MTGEVSESRLMLQLRATRPVPAGRAAVCLWAGFPLASEGWAVALSSH